MLVYFPHWYSNTTLVKVKYGIMLTAKITGEIQIQHLLKLNRR